MSVASLEFSSGKAEIVDVSKCVGDVSFQQSFYCNRSIQIMLVKCMLLVGFDLESSI